MTPKPVTNASIEIELEYRRFLEKNAALTTEQKVAAFDRIADKWSLIYKERGTTECRTTK